jgi:hypothetical protein
MTYQADRLGAFKTNSGFAEEDIIASPIMKILKQVYKKLYTLNYSTHW